MQPLFQSLVLSSVCTVPTACTVQALQLSTIALHDSVLQCWQDMHLLAERHILAGLKEGGWLQGELEEMLEQRIAALFMPHGMFPMLHPSHLWPSCPLQWGSSCMRAHLW